jgi:LacI family transcriptional regulator
MSRQPATVVDVARRARVSIATVSRVLTGSRHPVGEATRRRVLAAAGALDYSPSDIARGLLQRATRTIGLVIPDIANPYYPELARGVEDAAREAGYAVIFSNTDRDHERIARAIRVLRQKRVDGLIFAGGGSQQRTLPDGIDRFGAPVVAIGSHHLPFPSVRIDNWQASYAAVSHLIETGRRRVACVAGPPQSTTVGERVQGYQQALEMRRLPAPAHWLRYGDFGAASGYHEARALLEAAAPPDAILALNDRMAIGVLAAAADLKVRVPEDLGVVGFDDIPLASYLRPPLTTVRIPAYEMGAAAIRLLLAGIAGRPHPRAVRLEARLIVRGSTGAPPAAPTECEDQETLQRRVSGA